MALWKASSAALKSLRALGQALYLLASWFGLLLSFKVLVIFFKGQLLGCCRMLASVVPAEPQPLALARASAEEAK